MNRATELALMMLVFVFIIATLPFWIVLFAIYNWQLWE